MTARDLGACVLCGSVAKEAHHFTACLAGSTEYLDRKATIPLCVACHKAEHASWRAVRLDRLGHPLIARTARVAWTIGRLAGSDHPGASLLVPFHCVLLAIRDDVLELIGSDR